MSRKAGASMRPFAHPLPVGLFHLDPDPVPVSDESVSPEPAEQKAESDFRPITSQEEFNKKVEQRLAREREKLSDPTKAVISKSFYEELRQKADRLNEIEEQSKSELEKAMDRAEQAEERLKLIEAEAKETRLRAALVAEAAKPGRNIVDVDAAIALINRDDLEIEDSGVPTNIAEAMDSLLKAKPFLVAAHGGADLGARDHGGIKQVTEAELKTMTAEQIDQAHREGRLVKVLSR